MSSPSLVIRNGTIVDGSGGEPYEADLAVTDGKITAIGGNIPKGAEEINLTYLEIMQHAEQWLRTGEEVNWDPSMQGGFSYDEFWKHYDRKPEALAKFEALAKRGKAIPNFKAPEGIEKKLAEQEYQKGEIERSIKYLREVVGIGLKA